MAASGLSAVTTPRDTVAIAVTTTAYTSDDDDLSADAKSALGTSLAGNVPRNYVCLITQEIMENPVSDFFGHSYEKAAIKCWLNEHNTSPMTGKRLQKKAYSE